MSAIRALASSLGLSITTVSRALDGYSDVSAKTGERVRRAAKELGYRPHAAARRLRRGKSDTIAFVMPTEPGHFFEPAFTALLVEVGRRLAENHLDLALMASPPGPNELSTYQRLVEDRRADGCIVVRTRRDDPRVRFLQKQNFPFVCHGRTESAESYAYVDGDGETAFATLTTRLIRQGHRRIVHLGAPAPYTFSRLRATGWRRAMMESGLSPDLFRETDATEEGGYAATKELLAAGARPDAIVAATDRIAIGAMRALADHGLRAGTDVAVTGHDNISASAFTDPPLTTMELPIDAVAQGLVEKLLALIGGAKPESLTDVIAPVHILRASSGEA